MTEKEEILEKIKQFRIKISESSLSTERFILEHEIFKLHQMLGHLIELES